MLAPANAGCRDAGVLQAGDLVGERDVDHRRAGADYLRTQCPLALGIVVDAVVLGERLHHRGDRLAEAVADVLDAAGRVLDDVVQEADDLHALVVSGVAQDVGDRLGVGEPLARSGPDALRRASAGARRFGRDPARRYALAAPGLFGMGWRRKCPCDPSAAPAGRVGPRVITYFSICGRASRDDPENRAVLESSCVRPFAVSVPRRGARSPVAHSSRVARAANPAAPVPDRAFPSGQHSPGAVGPSNGSRSDRWVGWLRGSVADGRDRAPRRGTRPRVALTLSSFDDCKRERLAWRSLRSSSGRGDAARDDYRFEACCLDSVGR